MISTGQIFFFGGIIGTVSIIIVASICAVFMKKKGENIRSEIWKKYR